MTHEVLEPTLSHGDFQERFVQLHRQLWCSDVFEFDAVTRHVFSPPSGRYLADHTFIHDGEQWHLFYLTGDLRLGEQWNICRRAGDHEGANRVCVEPGNGHAVGSSLTNLRFQEEVCFPPQGRFDLMSRGVCSVFRFNGRYGMLYDVRGDRGEAMSLAWSDDLLQWTLDGANPVLTPPPWANPRGAFKDPHVMAWRGSYLIYVILWDQLGHPCVGLFTTKDWSRFEDHGVVFRMTPALRGTFGGESPLVFERDGMWHLMLTHGPGLWHAVGRSPTSFLSGGTAHSATVSQGSYLVGHFHATEVVCDGDRWWLTTDRKEEQRRRNRAHAVQVYRGTYQDEKPLEDGLYLSQIEWRGDQPTLIQPALGATDVTSTPAQLIATSR